MSAKCILHVRSSDCQSAAASRTRPCATVSQHPGIDVAASVVPHIDDESLAVEHGIKLARPLFDVVGAHGPQMHVADLHFRIRFHFFTPRVFPLGITQLRLISFGDGGHEHVAGLTGHGFNASKALASRLTAEQRHVHPARSADPAVDTGDDFAFAHHRIRPRQRWRLDWADPDRADKCAQPQSRPPFHPGEAARPGRDLDVIGRLARESPP